MTQAITHAMSLPIDRLDAHPANSNVMPKALLDKLAREVEETGLYPPVIVRPIGERYQILDGHHRVQVLRQLGMTDAQCVVWQADDRQALVLLATLNRLSGDEDPRKRAALLAELNKSMGVAELARRLPEDRERVRKLLAIHAAPPSPRAPTPIDQVAVCIHFFLMPDARRAVEKCLREHGGSREQALLQLLGVSTGDAHE